ncbi:MAG TPA: class I SAM-dependent methyltransferase [Candidatus Acidoferrum sp.]|nr:class I SAM-dependent methyltransferase [Candidatus Acidoferrum sp.]
MKVGHSMQQDWDERGRKDPFFYIASWRNDWNEEAFFESGEQDYERFVAHLLARRGVLPGNKSMIELGCGVGRMTRTFARKFGTVTACDVSSEMLNRGQALCRTEKNIIWLQSNGLDLRGIASNSTDFVFSYLVLQHMPKEEIVHDYIREMLRVLRNGGLCLFQFNGTSEKNMNWKGRVTWNLIDAMWRVRLPSVAKRTARILRLDPEMAGNNWHGVAVRTMRILKTVHDSGGVDAELWGENTPMAWCCASKAGSELTPKA